MENKIDKIIREAWKNHQTPFRDSYWNEMEKVLKKDRRRRRPLLWFFFGGLIAILSIVWVGYEIFQKGDVAHSSAGTEATVSKTMRPHQTEGLNSNLENNSEAPSSSTSPSDNNASVEHARPENDAISPGNQSTGQLNKELVPGQGKLLTESELITDKREVEKRAKNEVLNHGRRNYLSEGIDLLPAADPEVYNEDYIRPVSFLADNFNDIAAIEFLGPHNNASALPVPIELRPIELASIDACDLSIGAGYMVWPGGPVLHGPAINAEYSRKLQGIWSVSAGIQLSRLGGDYTRLQLPSEAAFSFGLGSKRQSIELNSMYLLSAPVSISRRIGGFKASAGLGPLYLAGIRGDRILETNFVDYKQGELPEFHSRGSEREAIWFESGAFREWNAMGAASVEWLAWPSTSVSLQMNYTLHPLERPSDDGHFFIGKDRRSSLMLTIKYYLR